LILAEAADCSAANTQLETSSSESLSATYAMYASLLEAQPASPCAKAGITAAGNLLAARKLHDAGMQTEVPKLVVDAIKAYPAARIPPELLTGLSSSDVVAKLYEAGLFAAGDEALKALIQSNPTASLPSNATLQERANRGFAVAGALEKKGYHGAALQALQQTLTTYPGAMPKGDAATLLGPDRPVWAPDWAYRNRDWFIAALSALLLLVLIGLITLRAWTARRRWFGGGRLLVASFQSGDAAAQYRDGFAQAVRDTIRLLMTSQGSDTIKMVSAFGDPATLPAAVSSIAPQADWISAIVGQIAKLLPNNDKSLTGFLHASKGSVVGLSLSLESADGRVLNRTSIWMSDYAPLLAATLSAAPPGDVRLNRSRRFLDFLKPGSPHQPTRPADPSLPAMYPLAYPAAVWALWALDPKHAVKLGSSKWQSFAYFGIGVNFQEQDDNDHAEEFYHRALAEDAQNMPAQFNLAALRFDGDAAGVSSS
jgi:tetratricopeptide (TPR) repeat protein